VALKFQSLPRPYKDLKKEMVDKVNNGDFLLGELVEQKSYERFILTSENKVIKKSFTIHARRIPPKEIRIKLFEKHKTQGNVFIFLSVYVWVLLYLTIKTLSHTDEP